MELGHQPTGIGPTICNDHVICYFFRQYKVTTLTIFREIGWDRSGSFDFVNIACLLLTYIKYVRVYVLHSIDGLCGRIKSVHTHTHTYTEMYIHTCALTYIVLLNITNIVLYKIITTVYIRIAYIHFIRLVIAVRLKPYFRKIPFGLVGYAVVRSNEILTRTPFDFVSSYLGIGD